MLRSLPNENFQIIRDFLKNYEYFQLMTTSKIFQDCKYNTCRWYLKRNDIEDFVLDEIVRATVLSLMKSPKNQLGIKMPLGFPEDFIFEAALDTESFLFEIYTSPSEGYYFLPMEKMEGREKIVIGGNNEIQRFDGITELTFQQLKIIRLSLCRSLVNVQGLSKVPIVILEGCDALIDISPLATVPDLQITRCKGIVDISALTHHHRLHIRSCPNINLDTVQFQTIQYSKTDLYRNSKQQFPSSLVSLELACYPELTYPTFPVDTLKYLEFFNCRQLIDVSPFHFLSFIHLCLCSEIIEIQGLQHVPRVMISSCSKLIDISGLGNNLVVTINSCPKIKSFSSLKTIKYVKLISCSSLVNGHELIGIKQLSLKKCDGIERISMLNEEKSLESLELIQCSLITSIAGTQYIPILHLQGIPLTSLKEIDIHHERIVLDKGLLSQWGRMKKLKDCYEEVGNRRDSETGFFISTFLRKKQI
jgi:hypothetical protein